MNKVFVTGLANRSFCSDCDHEKGGSGNRYYMSNFEFIPVIEQPEMALWIDKLVVSNNVRRIISSGSQQSSTMKAVGIILELFEKNNLVDYIDTDEILTDKVLEGIEKEIDHDLQALAKMKLLD